MWDIKIQPGVIDSLKELNQDAISVFFDFIHVYLAKLPENLTIEDTRKGEAKGISTFLRGTDENLIMIFVYIDYEMHLIKILHLAPRYYDYDKKLLKLLHRLFDETEDQS